MTRRLFLLPALALLLSAAGCERTDQGTADAGSPAVAAADAVPAPVAAAEAAEEIEWDALIPADWRPDRLLADYNADEMTDDDPRASELMEKLMVLWREAPVVPELDGRRVRLPGFVVPLDMDAETMGEFLLVPYYGACIHVPPPPANQTVHVVTSPGRELQGKLFDTVWVTGTLKVERSTSELAEAGYRIQGASTEPYEDGSAPRQEE